MRGKKEIQAEQVIQLIAEGKANKEIATQLHKSKHTIDGIVRQLLRLHSCRNRTELAIKFMKVA
jgi:DNA-binding NarL/FixJ family response regulator